MEKDTVLHGQADCFLACDDIRAAAALTCLVYNIFRYVQINKYQPQLIASMG